MDKSRDILYLATNAPDKLVAYNTKLRKIDRELALNKTPKCFSISGDGHKALIDYEKQIDLIDIDNFMITKTIELNHIVGDVEWADNDWFCYSGTKENMQYSYLLWVKSSTNEKHQSLYDIYSRCTLKKIPNQKYIVAFDGDISSRLHIFDVDTKENVNNLYGFFGPFWFTENGEYLVDALANVYSTSVLPVQNAIHPSGRLEYQENYYYNFYIPWIDHSEVTNSVWGLHRNIYNDITSEIKQFKVPYYLLVKRYYYDDLYVTGSNGNTVEKQVEARYLFANSSGTELIVIKTTTDGTNIWAIEFIAVN
jgi:hypothetical protein